MAMKTIEDVCVYVWCGTCVVGHVVIRAQYVEPVFTMHRSVEHRWFFVLFVVEEFNELFVHLRV